nr:hypothetical protein L204_03349 [Cryptococcus depauperatus CBS 7855]
MSFSSQLSSNQENMPNINPISKEAEEKEPQTEPKQFHNETVLDDGTIVREDQRVWDDEHGKGKIWIKSWKKQWPSQTNPPTGKVNTLDSIDDDSDATAYSHNKKNHALLDVLLRDSYRSGYNEAMSHSRHSPFPPFPSLGGLLGPPAFPKHPAFWPSQFDHPPKWSRLEDDCELETWNEPRIESKVYSWTGSTTGSVLLAAALAGASAIYAWRAHKTARSLEQTVRTLNETLKTRTFSNQDGSQMSRMSEKDKSIGGES